MDAWTWIAVVAGCLGGLLHVGVWMAESLLWSREAVWRAFGARSADEAQAQAVAMYNVGYYNLFLGLGTIVGAIVFASGGTALLLGFGAAFMVGAGLVLITRSAALWRGALAQALPGVVALIGIWIALT